MPAIVVIVRDVSSGVLLDLLAAIWADLEAVFYRGAMPPHPVLFPTRCIPAVSFIVVNLPGTNIHQNILSIASSVLDHKQ
jgi:hypothetical protein